MSLCVNKVNRERGAFKGFTLIELLVAMTVAAVLMSLALVSYQGARKAARDGKRKTDLEQIRSALEMYRSDNGHYFYPAGHDPTTDYSVPLSSDGSDALQSALINGGYLSAPFADPVGGQIDDCTCSARANVCDLVYYYRYLGSNGRFFLVATLETEKDAQVWQCISGASQTCFTPEGAYGFNYMVCSP